MLRAPCFLVCAFSALILPGLHAAEPTAINLGAGSYASFPPAHEGATPTAMLDWPIYTETTHRPIPSNDWWTDLLVSRYAGTMWALPFGVAADGGGLVLYYSTNWNGNGRTLVQEFPLRVEGVVPVFYDTNDLLITDFEATNYPAGWTTTGSAFGSGPAAGAAAGQSAVSGFMGSRLVNSYRPGDGATGTLRSAPFPISHSNLHFLSAGGNWPTQTAVRLTVNGTVVRTTTGENSENLKWHTWDVSDLVGQTGRLDLIDTATGGWGHLCADQFFLSNDPTNQAGKWSTAFLPRDARATDWSDWLVSFALMQDASRRLDITMGRGLPFVWINCTGVDLRIRSGIGVRYFNEAGTLGGFPVTTDHVGVAYAGRAYGLFAPDGTQFSATTSVLSVTFTGTNRWLAIGVMNSTNDLAFFQNYAYAQPTNTVLNWTYDVEGGRVHTDWSLQTKVLKGTNTQVLQGWMPHHYRTTSNDLAWTGRTYVTPRGRMKLAAGQHFHIAYPFSGILPNLPAPHATGAYTNDFDRERMESYLATGATKTDYGADTYWGGKDLINFGRFLAFAHELDQAGAETLKQTLRSALADWLTYTPGETAHYFASYPNWRALVGFNESYGSGQFNDHHFHYGYLTAAAALLGLYDPDFLADYGPMLTAVAREYANWDRSDTNFPFLRTFDPWGGHSYAGGFSAGNGNNQESSSESMQAWGGLFTLGHVMGDTNMLATGALGYAMESEAIAEYWNNYYGYRDGPTNGTFAPAYSNSIVGILFDDGNAYATYFSGDPGWIYGIQWLPISPFLNYTVRDPVFARYQYTNMMALRDVEVGATTNTISRMGNALGNVILGYLQLFDPEQAIAIDTALWSAGDPVANDTFNSGINYYFMHANRRLGVPRFDHHIGTPFSQVYAAGTTLTYVAYNTHSNLQLVSVYSNTTRLGFIALPPRQLTSTRALLATSATFSVTATFPANGETTTVSQIAVVFSQNVNTGTLAGATINGPGVTGLSLNGDSAGPLLLFDLAGTPVTGATYQVNLPADTAAQAGATLGAPFPFVFTIAAPTPTQPVEFLKGHFPLNETNGTVLLDQSAYAQNGFYTNAPLLAQSGATNGTGTSVSFDGVDDFGVLEKTYKLGFNGNFTVTAWLRASSVSGDRPVLGTDRRETHKGLQLMIRNGHPVLGFYGDETTGTNTLSTGRWYHVAWRFYRGTQALFVNGILDTASTGHGYFAGIDPVLLGRWGGLGGTPAYFAGRLDDVQIYGRALTDTEINTLYLAPATSNPDGLQNFAPLVEAGPERSAMFPGALTITGSVLDDDLPDPPHAMSVLWTQVDGPSTVVFDEATNLTTSISAAQPGSYTLRLTADDGEFQTQDDVTIWLTVTNYFGLVLRYRLDETNGLSARDSAGSALHGTLVGTPLLGQPGPGDAPAVGFNGANQYIRIGNPSLLNNLTHDFTVALWVRPTSYGGNRVLFGSNWQDQTGWSLRFSGTNLALERLGPAQVYYAGTSLPPGTWSHVAAVYGATNDVTFYINGIAVTNIPGSSPASPATRPWYVAANGGDFFNGRLDDLHVYARALPASEVAYLYQNPGRQLTDTDQDGMNDAWEAAHGLVVGAHDDADNPDLDAWDNKQEYIADSDPGLANPPIEVTLQRAGNAMNLSTIPATTNSRTYRIYATTNLVGETWVPIGPAQTGAEDGGAMTTPITNTLEPTSVYRITIQEPTPE